MLFEEIYSIKDVKHGNLLIKEYSGEKRFHPHYIKMSIDYGSIPIYRSKLEELFQEYKEYLDNSFNSGFKGDKHISYIGELLSFLILEKNNFHFTNQKTKKNEFPDIMTIENEMFEVIATIKPIEGELTNNLRDRDDAVLTRITSGILEKNSKFEKANKKGNLIYFLGMEDVVIDERIFWKLQNGNADLVYNIRSENFSYENIGPFKKKDIYINPLSFNNRIISNIKSILFIGIGPIEFLWNQCGSTFNNIHYWHWKNEEFEGSFDLKL